MSHYAYVCPKCNHPESRHLLIGESIAGPYLCHYGRGTCKCEMMRGQSSIALSRAQFEQRFPDWPVES